MSHSMKHRCFLCLLSVLKNLKYLEELRHGFSEIGFWKIRLMFSKAPNIRKNAAWPFSMITKP